MGCAKYEAGNRDRDNCDKLSSGMSAADLTSLMGKPRLIRRSAGGEEIWAYETPSMPDLPMFSGDKPVELVLETGPSGTLLKQAFCSGED